MNVIFYTFSKKPNSTKRPTGGTTYSCLLKDDCSIINPSIKLDLGTTTAPTFNYAYISDFGRYYFIDSWTWSERLWIADMTIDVLATYKTEIGNATLYVLRSASKFNTKVIDTYYPLKYDSTYTSNQANDDAIYAKNASGTTASGANYRFWNRNYFQGTIILGALTGHDDATRGLNFYAIDPNTYESIVLQLMDLLPDSPGDLPSWLTKNLFKPIQYITNVFWIPTKLPGISLSNDYCYIGSTKITVPNGSISAPIDIINSSIEYKFTIDIPEHPYTSARGLWLNTEPFTQLTLSFLPFGVMPLPMSKLAGYTKIVCRVVLDIPSGNSELFVHPGSNVDTYGPCIVHNTSMFGVPLSLGQSTVDYINAIGSATSAVGQFVSGLDTDSWNYETLPDDESLAGHITRDVMGGISNVSPKSIGSLANALTPINMTSGSPGSSMAFTQFGKATLYAQFFYPVDEDNAHQGRPLCEDTLISTLSGYIRCKDEDIDLSATQEERESVGSYLVSGFFYE